MHSHICRFESTSIVRLCKQNAVSNMKYPIHLNVQIVRFANGIKSYKRVLSCALSKCEAWTQTHLDTDPTVKRLTILSFRCMDTASMSGKVTTKRTAYLTHQNAWNFGVPTPCPQICEPLQKVDIHGEYPVSSQDM